MPVIDSQKRYKTRSGKNVSNLHYDKTGPLDYFPWMGDIEGNKYSVCWTVEGEYLGKSDISSLDLIEVQPEKEMSEIDFTKPIQTDMSKELVTIITTEGRGQYPVIGYVGDSNKPSVWTEEGRKQHGFVSGDDLVNVPPPKHIGYINIYENRDHIVIIRDSRSDCDKHGDTNEKRIACVRIEYIEGQFDK